LASQSLWVSFLLIHTHIHTSHRLLPVQATTSSLSSHFLRSSTSVHSLFFVVSLAAMGLFFVAQTTPKKKKRVLVQGVMTIGGKKWPTVGRKAKTLLHLFSPPYPSLSVFVHLTAHPSCLVMSRLVLCCLHFPPSILSLFTNQQKSLFLDFFLVCLQKQKYAFSSRTSPSFSWCASI
jgi:hypothetical protein